MISALHMIWIVPLCVCAGFFYAALCVAVGRR